MKRSQEQGYILVTVLVVGILAVYTLVGLVTWAAASLKTARRAAIRERAVQAAEAGIDYYRWHLAHAPQDFQDGTGGPGPYRHDFRDKDGRVLGEFLLDITPPAVGSTVVTIRSTGTIGSDTTNSRTIVSQLAKPSIAQYAVLANAAMRFGAGTEVIGPVHVNGGIRFDGVAQNTVSSSVASYDDPDHSGGNEFGVHTHVSPVDPLPPAAVPVRADVFRAGRRFPVPAVDFAGITANLAQMRTDAQTNGFYRTGSGTLGYHVVLRNNDTFDLRRVTGLTTPPVGCTNIQNQPGWSTWSIATEQLIGTYPLPANGIIFLEDNIFVDGQINTARVTIVAALFPDNPPTRKNITINQDLLYTNYNGQDVVGLIAQGNINVGMVSDNDLRIDGGLVAQNGRVGRYYYRSQCTPYHVRQTLTLWGMIATNQRYGFAYTDGTGYQTRNLNYDAQLLYAPPPSFPLTSDQYAILSWEEM